MTHDNFIDHFRLEFFQEAREILENISDDILKLEADPENSELLNSVFRGIHTIKGSAGSFELGIISDFTHHLEGLLNALRDGKISLSPDMVDVILSGSDEIAGMIDMCADGGTPELNYELIDRIAACLEKDKNIKPDSHDDASDREEKPQNITEPSQGTQQTEKEQDSTSYSISIKKGSIPDDMYDSFLKRAENGDNIFKITLKYTSAHFENGYDPLVFLKNLYEASSLYYAALKEPNPLPQFENFEPLQLYLDPIIYAAASMTLKEVYDLVFDEELIEVEELIEKISDPAGSKQTDSKQSSYFQHQDKAGESKRSSSDSFEDIIRSKEAMAEFIEGSLDMLQTAEKAVMQYEENGSISALDELFRVVHNIKGDSDLMGFKDLVTFTHAFESVLDLLRLKKLERSQDIVELALQSVDFIKGAFADIEAEKNIRPHTLLYKRIRHYLDSQRADIEIRSEDGSSADSDDLSDDLTEQSQFVIEDKELNEVYIEQILQFKAILIQLMDKFSASNSNADPIFLNSIKRTLKDIIKASSTVGHKSLEESASQAFSILAGKENDIDKASTEKSYSSLIEDSITNTLDAMSGLLGEPKKIGEILISEGKIKEDDLNSALEAQKPVGQILLESGKITKDDLDSALTKQKIISMTPASKISSAQASDEPQGIKTMRVDEHKVESFSNLVGEMLIARNTYAYLLSRLASAQEQSQTSEIIKDLKENLHLFARLTNDVQHGVISLRMIPIRGIFQKFSRVVRDISRKQNKMIQIMTDGEDIEIDKKVADVLSDPLVHLIRNSCDHGIETPVERKKAGKTEKGTILLKASREGSNIVIRINDDGRGINKTKLLEKAQKLGLNFTSVNDPGLMDIIFMPGLSTAEQITDVSGRGVGMDVVKTTIHSLGGTVSVMSEAGEGTQITLTIPTSMGIDTVLFVEAGGNSYAIPINYIIETLKVQPDKFIRAGDQLMFYYRGEVISVHFLDELLDYDSILSSDSNQLLHNRRDMGNDDIPMVIIKTSRDKYGVIIDRFDKNMEIAVKPLPSMLSGLDVISGISILGDGKVLLVINPEQLAG